MSVMGEEEGGELSCQVALKTRPRNNIKNTPKIHIYVYIYIYNYYVHENPAKITSWKRLAAACPPRGTRQLRRLCVCLGHTHVCTPVCMYTYLCNRCVCVRAQTHTHVCTLVCVYTYLCNLCVCVRACIAAGGSWTDQKRHVQSVGRRIFATRSQQTRHLRRHQKR